MAGGWARDDAVNDQIEVSTQEALQRMRLRSGTMAAAESAEFCAECDEEIPQARREAIPGVQFCIDCQSGRDKAWKPSAGFNRRGSKDSQLR